MPLEYWTQEQFAQMSWHDNYVHALRIVQGEHGAGELVLDLDYILEWVKSAVGMRFRILPVHLRFIDVAALRITLEQRGWGKQVLSRLQHLLPAERVGA